MESSATFSYRLVLTTCGSEEEATKLARALVERRLVACVNVLPGMRSFYRWQGAVQNDSEAQLLMKTRQDKLANLESAVHELHSYDLPEFVVIPVVAGSAGYLSWIDQNVADESI